MQTSGVDGGSNLSTTRSLRGALRARTPLLTTFLLLPRVEIVELAAKAGFAAIVIDLEHGPIGVSDLPALASAARSSGIYAVARVSRNSPTEIGQALDAGVDGVMVPHVSSLVEAQQVVTAGRFLPEGERSINPYTRGNGYDLRSQTAAVNERTALIAMLEGNEVMSNLDAICSVQDLDALFIGPVDLSASLGIAGDSEHPAVIAAVRKALAHIHAAGCITGVYADNPAAGARWIAAGASFVAVSADVAVMLNALASVCLEVRTALGEHTDGTPPRVLSRE